MDNAKNDKPKRRPPGSGPLGPLHKYVDGPHKRALPRFERVPVARPRQVQYVEYLLCGVPGPEAARRAGYKSSSLHSTAVFLQTPSVQRYLNARLATIIERNDLHIGKLIAAAERIVFADPAGLFGPNGKALPIDKVPLELRLAIEAVTVSEYKDTRDARHRPERRWKYKLCNRGEAQDKLFRYLALYKDVGSKDNPLTVVPPVLDVAKLHPDDLAELASRLKQLMQKGDTVDRPDNINA